MEVAPTAHYSMGGILVSPDEHKTSVDGIFVAEKSQEVLHGAQFGGNSLAEILYLVKGLVNLFLYSKEKISTKV